MDTTSLPKKFDQLGARAKVRPFPARRANGAAPGRVVIDIGKDRAGEFFDIQAATDAVVEVLDVQRDDRHLLLMVRQTTGQAGEPEIKSKFLCGHDERHWFVAAIPETAGASSVVTAKEALKPLQVRNLERGQKGKREKRHSRKTEVFVRQGEWFFIPEPNFKPQEKLVLRNEPLRRGGGKPHVCEYLYRDGGTTVYVCGRHPNGLTEGKYNTILSRYAEAAKWQWRTMRRNPAAYVRGKVSHSDHATIRLPDWHRVLMNTENESRAMASVAFLD